MHLLVSINILECFHRSLAWPQHITVIDNSRNITTSGCHVKINSIDRTEPINISCMDFRFSIIAVR